MQEDEAAQGVCYGKMEKNKSEPVPLGNQFGLSFDGGR